VYRHLKKPAVATSTWLLLVFSCSCATLRRPSPPPDLLPLDQGSLARLDGRYSIISVDSAYRKLDWLFLTSELEGVAPESGLKRHIVFKALDGTHLKISLLDEVGIVAEKVCKVRIKQGYCKLPAYTDYFSEFVVINGYSTRAARISLLRNGNLTVDEAHAGIHFVLILPVVFPESFQRQSHLEFKRIGD
jgi:hypothetical protein